jgi:iron complex transport system substrate-binding protein
MVPYPLELLVRDKPDVVLVTHAYEKTPSLADEIARHPAIRALGSDTTGNVVPPGSWACGGAFTIEAVEALRRLRDTLAKPQEGHAG